MRRIWMSFVLMFVCAFVCTNVNGQSPDVNTPDVNKWEFMGLTNAASDKVEGRVGYLLDETFTLGALGTYYANETISYDWSLGVYAKMSVDPNTVVPISELFPFLGEFLNFPVSVNINNYLIGKFEVIPYGAGVDMALSGGIGIQIGPFIAEWVYQMVEGGDSDNPLLNSTDELWIGICWQI